MSAPVRPHDEANWMIPRDGTLARKVYDLAITGLSSREIAIQLDEDVNKVRVMVCRIKNPVNRWGYGSRNKAGGGPPTP